MKPIILAALIAAPVYALPVVLPASDFLKGRK